MKTRIAVLDYDIGNVRSVVKALEYLGAEAVLTSEKEKIFNAHGLVVPGVSAFGACMTSLVRKNLVELLLEYINSGRKYLGICLGYQILFEKSEESPEAEGLSVFKGTVRKFPGGLRVPHIGWNSLNIKIQDGMFEGIQDGSYFYFVHSYFPEPEDPGIISATTEYGIEFASAVESENIRACQFHPEKSSKQGLKLLENFLRWCQE